MLNSAVPDSVTHVIGAGLAGLAASLALSDAGRRVIVHESANAAGGRCRSYFDKLLDRRIDNGNHLLLSGNRAAFAYLDRIGARHTIGGPDAPRFPFIDRRTGERWTLELSAGRLPWWMLHAARRVPGTRLTEYLRLIRLQLAGPDRTVAEAVAPGPLFHRLIAPLAIASLNTNLERASASLFAAVIRETLMQGGTACVPGFARDGLSESLVDPALAALRTAGAELRLGHRITGLQIENDHVRALLSPDGPIPLASGDGVVLAVPAPVAAELLPGLVTPDEFCAIVNVHFRLEAGPQEAGFTGVIGGAAEWVFVKPGIASITISAADAWIDRPADVIAAAVWPDVAAACALPEQAMPPFRVIKEKRATFAATPAQQRRRPVSHTSLQNLSLAGDWTATGLPATIEGAIRSGRNAAAALLEREYHA